MNNLLPRLLLLLTFVAVISSSSRSQDSSHHAAITLELLNTLNVQRNVEQAMDILLDAQLRARPDLKKYEDVMRAFFSKYMSWEILRDKYVAIYMAEFTEADMQAMLDFYKTEVGKKSIEKVPVLLSKGAEMGRSLVQEHMDELNEAIHKRAEEFKTGKK